MNFLQLTQRLYRELGRSGTPPQAYANADAHQLRLFDAINASWLELQTDRTKRWKWMRRSVVVPLVPGTYRYTGASLGLADFGRWRTEDHRYNPRCCPPGQTWPVYDLTWFPLDDFKSLYLDIPPATTTPVSWTADDDQALLIGPTPDKAYNLKIDYIAQATELEADDDVPSLPTEFHMLLVWEALTRRGVFDAAPEVVQLALDHRAAMRSRLLSDQGELPDWT